MYRRTREEDDEPPRGAAFRSRGRRLAVALCAVSALAALARDGLPGSGCPPADFSLTFVQPLARDADRGEAGWRTLFARLGRMGIGEVVFQWTSFDDFDTYPRGTGKTTLLSDAIKAAEREGTRLWIGLHDDRGFWTVADRPIAEVRRYFTERSAALDERLPALSSIMEAHPATVAGWYIGDEIDDTRWRDPERRAALLDHLIETRRRLSTRRPDLPVMISAFANGVESPRDYASFLADLVETANIDRLLFQDGVGAGKLTPTEAVAYLAALSEAGRDRFDTVPIVELFEIGPDGHPRPAPLERIVEQVALEAPFAPTGLAAFSVPHHMSPEAGAGADALYRRWRGAAGACSRLAHSDR